MTVNPSSVGLGNALNTEVYRDLIGRGLKRADNGVYVGEVTGVEELGDGGLILKGGNIIPLDILDSFSPCEVLLRKNPATVWKRRKFV